MKFILKNTNQWGEVHYFANLGGFWGPGDTRRLIERVTEKAANARQFDTVEEAKEVLTLSDNTDNPMWEIVDENGSVVK